MTEPELSFDISDEQIAKAKIVVVDDEELITSTLLNFLSIDLDIDAIAFNDPQRALKHIESEEVDLVISDFLMPGLDGIKLLGGARRAQPQAPRVLLTGYADKENAIRAINDVQLYQYVEKPWDNGQLKSIVKNGLERKFLIRNLTESVIRLATKEKDLQRLKTGLVRAFA